MLRWNCMPKPLIVWVRWIDWKTLRRRTGLITIDCHVRRLPLPWRRRRGRSHTYWTLVTVKPSHHFERERRSGGRLSTGATETSVVREVRAGQRHRPSVGSVQLLNLRRSFLCQRTIPLLKNVLVNESLVDASLLLLCPPVAKKGLPYETIDGQRSLQCDRDKTTSAAGISHRRVPSALSFAVVQRSSNSVAVSDIYLRGCHRTFWCW